MGLSREALAWAGGAGLLGVAVGVGAGTGPKVAAALVLMPALAALLLRPDWLPVLLLVTVFAEAVSFGGMSIARVAGPLAILVLILRLGLDRPRLGLPRKALLVALAAYCTWALGSTLWTVNLDLSFAEGGTAFALSSLALSLAYLFAVAILIEDEAQLRRAAFVVWGMSVVVGAIGVLQYLGPYERSVGLNGDPNFYAAVQVIALPIGAVVATQLVRGGARTFVLASLTIVVGSIVTSLSRGGLLALALMMVLLAFQPSQTFFRTRARKSAFLGFMTVGAVALVVLSFSALQARTNSLSGSDSAGSGRAYLWDAALISFHEHPLFGIGFGAFASQSNELLLRTPSVDFRQYALRPEGQPVHNSYLESFTELGVLGGALFLGLLATALATLRWAAREAARQREPFLGALARGLQLSLAGFAITSIFLSAETHRTLWVLLGLAIALTRVLAAKRAASRPAAHI